MNTIPWINEFLVITIAIEHRVHAQVLYDDVTLFTKLTDFSNLLEDMFTSTNVSLQTVDVVRVFQSK
jgi:hypothetical protein